MQMVCNPPMYLVRKHPAQGQRMRQTVAPVPQNGVFDASRTASLEPVTAPLQVHKHRPTDPGQLTRASINWGNKKRPVAAPTLRSRHHHRLALPPSKVDRRWPGQIRTADRSDCAGVPLPCRSRAHSDCRPRQRSCCRRPAHSGPKTRSVRSSPTCSRRA